MITKIKNIIITALILSTISVVSCHRSSSTYSVDEPFDYITGLVSLEVTPYNKTIPVGCDSQFTAMGIYSDNTTKNITQYVEWESTDSDAAGVNQNGLVTGKTALSSTIINASVPELSVSSETALFVSGAELTSITVNPTFPSVAMGLPVQFTGIGHFTDGTTQTVTNTVEWNSSDSGILSVSNAPGDKGLAASNLSGIVIITAVWPVNGISKEIEYTVLPKELIAIEITPANSSIGIYSSLQCTATGIYSDNTTIDITDTVQWESSNTASVTITAIGRVAGVSTNSTTIISAIISSSGLRGETEMSVSNAVLESIEVTPSSSSLPLGKTVQYIATGIYDDSTTQDVTAVVSWESSDPINVSININGLAKGLVSGETESITATMSDVFPIISGNTEITITDPILDSIEISPVSSSIPLGLSQQFTALGTYTNDVVLDITTLATWDSTHWDIASISNNSGTEGLVSTSNTGTTTISAVYNGITQTTTVTVGDPVLLSLEILPGDSFNVVGLKTQFIANGFYSDGSTKEITNSVLWDSSDHAIATVSNFLGGNGLGDCHGIGDVTITATMPATTITNSAALHVVDVDLVSIEVTPANLNMPLGNTQQMIATGIYSDLTTQDITLSVTWESLDENAVIITNTGISEGVIASTSATIKAAMPGTDVSGSTIITISAPELVSIDITPNAPTLALDSNLQFTAIGNYTDGTTQDVTSDVNWTSFDETIASITNSILSKGNITSYREGVITITAEMPISGISGTTELTVEDYYLVAISVTPINPMIAIGTTQQYKATGIYSNNHTKDLTDLVTWESSDEGSATINASGLAQSMTALSSTIISAEYDGFTDDTSLSIKDTELASISVTTTNTTIVKGLTRQFTATGTFTDTSTQDITNDVLWISSDESRAEISILDGSKGLLSSLNTGLVIIEAEMPNTDISGTIEVNIIDSELLDIQVTPINTSLAKGLSCQFTATGVYTDCTQDITNAVTWTSLNTSYVTINATGSGYGAGIGTATVRGELSGVTGDTLFTVTLAVMIALEVTPEGVSMPLGREQQYTAMGIYTDASQVDVTASVLWSSSNTGTAEISNADESRGLAQTLGKSTGTTTISAITTDSAFDDDASLTVIHRVLDYINLDPNNSSQAADKTIIIGNTKQIRAYGVYSNGTEEITNIAAWSSGTPGSATVNSSGLVTGVSPRYAAITVSHGSKSASITVGVPGTVMLVSEGFDGGEWPPAGWYGGPFNNDNWHRLGAYSYDGSDSANFDCRYTNWGNLITYPFNMLDLTNCKLEFYYRSPAQHFMGGVIHWNNLYIQSYAGGSWTTHEHLEDEEDWVKKTYSLNNNVTHVNFRAHGGDFGWTYWGHDHDTHVDKVRISGDFTPFQ